MADNHRIAVENAFVDHRFAIDFERVVPAHADHVGGNADAVGGMVNGLDRQPGGDFLVTGNLYCGAVFQAAHGLTDGLGTAHLKVAADDIRLEGVSFRAFVRGLHVFRAAQDFKGAGPVRQTTDKPAFLKPRNQPVDARL